jgi:hypothetical protein
MLLLLKDMARILRVIEGVELNSTGNLFFVNLQIDLAKCHLTLTDKE